MPSFITSLNISDKTFLLIIAIGALSGLLIGLQEIGFDWLLNKTWMGWRITLKKIAFSTLSLSALFGFGAYAIIAWQPIPAMQMPAQAAISLFIKIGILISVVTPISGQLMLRVSDRDASNDS
ncbi:MAG: hypothetical protein AAF703_10660 [Cyanobacteria bacterium P01_D01_bin.105]